ncbi:serine/threonine-protein kinase PknD [Filimonas sp.]|nr:serine/threonine-protein kinase PknD [Filimonas sp.]
MDNIIVSPSKQTEPYGRGGSNDNGQLGDGTNTLRKSPVKIGTAANWTSVAAGESHSHALKSNGTLWAWGRNSNGELGDGSNSNTSSPVQIGSFSDWVSIKSGFQFSTGVRSDANRFCSTGDNSIGQLGHGNNVNLNTFGCDSITFQCVLSTQAITPLCGELTADLNTGIASEIGAYSFSFYTDAALTIAPVNPVSVAGMYYVKATTSYGCDLTDSILVNAFNPNPSAPTGVNGTGCGTSVSINLSATSGVGETVDWYSESTDGVLLASGTNSFSTPGISSTKIYYAEARNIASGCISLTRTAVTAFVNVLNTTPTISSYINAGINSPEYIAFDAAGNMYVSSASTNTIEKVDVYGFVSTFVNTGLSSPSGLAFDASGNLYVANTGSNNIKKITSGGSVSTFVNTGLSAPTGLAFDTTGNLYVANTGSNNIKKVTSGGSISTFVSSGLNSPKGLAFDIAGNLYAANAATNTISKINKFGAVTTFVSFGLNSPAGLAFDATGNLYAANSGSNTIAEIDPSGSVSVFVNSGMSTPHGLSFDGAGNLFVANNGNHTISKITLAPPSITSFAPVNRPSGETVTIFGHNLQGTSAVSFGNTAAASFTVVNDTTITAVVGSGASGKVMVTNAVCSDSLAGFTYCIRPLSPLSADTTICYGQSANLSATGVMS